MAVTRKIVLGVPLLLAACASQPEYQPPLPTLPTSVSMPVPVVRQAPPDVLPEMPKEDPVKATMAAAGEGIVKPRKDWFKGIVYKPPYHPHHSYLVYTPEGNTTVFMFQPGEKPQQDGASCDDGGQLIDANWSSMGNGAGRSYVMKLKVKVSDVRRECTITTNAGIYSVIVQSMTKAHTRRVSWSDPYHFLSEPDEEAPDICGGGDMNYTLEGDPGAFGIRLGDITNNGNHTCIRFPQSAAFDLPTVFLIEGDQERPASPSMIDGAWVIDGVPPIIELRSDTATIRIQRAVP